MCQDTLYAVEDVLDMRSSNGGREFLIRWEECPGQDSWEPEANLLPSLVREYLEHQEAELSKESDSSEDEKQETVAEAVRQQGKRSRPAPQLDSSDEEAMVQLPQPHSSDEEAQLLAAKKQKAATTQKRKQPAPAPAPAPPPKRVRPPPTVRIRS